MAKQAASPRRPRRLPMILMSLLSLLLVVVIAALAILIPPNFDMINSFLAPPPDAETVAQARQASADMTQQVVSEGIILLENRDGTLPLAEGTPVNLFGYGSRDTVYGGSGSGSGDSTNNVTVAQGLENAGFSVNPDLVTFYDEHYVSRSGVGFTGNNFDINEPAVSEYSEELLRSAEEFSDVALFVVSRLGGEGADLPMDMDPNLTTTTMASGMLVENTIQGGDAGKHYLELQQSELDVLEMVKEHFDTVIVLVNATNAMELGFVEDEGIDAALWIGCLGSTGANAVGDVLCGKVNPSGRTTDTFAYDVTTAPSYYTMGDRDYTNLTYVNNNPIGNSKDPDNYHYIDYVEGIYVGYRFYETAAADGYLDYDSTVQYPFGYGLSYTDFTQEITDFTDDGATVSLTVKVTNTGTVAGKTVAQVYFTPPYTSGGIEKSHVVLADFAKTSLLAPGDSETLTLSFLREDMASYDYTGIKAEGGAYVLEAGDYQIKLMADSHTVIDSRTISVAEDVIYNDANDGARSTDGIAAVNRFDDVSFGEDVTYVSRADWAGTMPSAPAPAGREASETVLAALQDTTVTNDDSAQDIVFADHDLSLDDMKGLDYDDPKWELLLEQISVDEMANLINNGGWATQAVASVGKPSYVEVDGPNGINNIMTGTTGNQYCGQSVLAYSWNAELAYAMGQTYAREAIAMDIAALYAPAMNIHRSPFSGRNYEYYSEDGLFSGKMAAAEVQGLQSEGVTPYCKHFAVNDQETNRDSGGLCTWVNEQAMREIYMKGFELAVKEGGTRGIMSSFNRLGTTCTAESYDLLTTVLRQEWGFQGAVITDCIMQLGYINPDRAVRAGNDLTLALMNLVPLTDATTGTAAGHQAMREATHHILYAAANGLGQEISSIPVAYGVYIPVAVVLAALVALCCFYFVRRHKAMRFWKDWSAAQAKQSEA